MRSRYSSFRQELFLCIILLALLGCKDKSPNEPQADTQAPNVSITNPAGNATVTGVVTIRANAMDNVGVTKVEFLIDGVLKSTDNGAPWEFGWDSEGEGDGNHTILAKAYDAAANVGSSSVVNVTVQVPLDLTFSNAVYTDISLNVSGQGSQTIPPGGSFTYKFQSNPGSVSYSASTSGKTAQGGQVGLLITWNYTIDVSGKRFESAQLITNPDLFFIYIRNAGTVRLTPFYVNYGLVDQTRDNILIPPDGATYRTGYYKAYANTEVRAYHEPNPFFYSYWTQGSNFRLPFTTNQFVTLVNNSLAGTQAGSGEQAEISERAPELLISSAPPERLHKISVRQSVLKHAGRASE